MTSAETQRPIHERVEVVDPWTHMFDIALDTMLADAKQRAEQQGAAIPQSRKDLFRLTALLSDPQSVSETGPALFYQGLGKEVGYHLPIRPQRDDVTREAARYAAGLAKEFIGEHTTGDMEKRERDRVQTIIGASMAVFAVGIVINTKSDTILGGQEIVEEQENGSAFIYDTPGSPVVWRGRTTRDRVVKEFHASMQG